MIKIEIIKEGVIRVSPIGKLQPQDIDEVMPQINQLNNQMGQINVLVDARKFNGWQNVETFKYHINVIKSHYYNVGNVAILIGSFWQTLILSVVKMAMKQDLKTFKAKQAEEALAWVSNR